MPKSFLSFARAILGFIREWDLRNKLTRAELERALQWWNEDPNCCPEAIAMDIRFIYPDLEQMRDLTRFF